MNTKETLVKYMSGKSNEQVFDYLYYFDEDFGEVSDPKEAERLYKQAKLELFSSTIPEKLGNGEGFKEVGQYQLNPYWVAWEGLKSPSSQKAKEWRVKAIPTITSRKENAYIFEQQSLTSDGVYRRHPYKLGESKSRFGDEFHFMPNSPNVRRGSTYTYTYKIIRSRELGYRVCFEVWDIKTDFQSIESAKTACEVSHLLFCDKDCFHAMKQWGWKPNVYGEVLKCLINEGYSTLEILSMLASD